jgi:dolichyl-phosphate-mannose-protein mannosyltransferase
MMRLLDASPAPTSTPSAEAPAEGEGPAMTGSKARAVAAGFTLLKLGVQLAALPGYGYFRDELYYLACSDRLAWGYVDHPPLSVALLKVVRLLFGDSLWALRAIPALAGALLVFLTGEAVRALGGGVRATAVACAAVVGAPVLLGMNHFWSMNALDGLFWMSGVLLFVRAFGASSPRWWAALGAALGLGLLNKASLLWLGAGFGVALTATREGRAHLRRPGPYVAAAVAALIVAPHVAWQIGHGWPTLEFARNALAEKYKAHSPIGFLLEAALLLGPASAPLWLAGPLAALRRPGLGRALGLAWVTVVAVLAFSKSGKAEYLAAGFFLPAALGAVELERALGRLARGGAALATAAASVLAAQLVLAPLALPLLPVPRYLAYAAALGVKPSTSENKALGALPQFFADMHGWREQVAAIEAAAARLRPEERAHAAIWVRSGGYGSAAAVELFGRGKGLPRVISGHNTYWLWGYGDADGSAFVLAGGRLERLREEFAEVEEAGVVDCGLCMPYENGKKLFVARGLRRPMAEVWQRWRSFE